MTTPAPPTAAHPLPDPLCFFCRHPIGTPVHLLACKRFDRVCVECDTMWAAAAPGDTERCPTAGCQGVGEPLPAGPFVVA